jgi:phosphate/sulfate permease
LSSTFAGVPISGTHTVVGALIGAGLIAVGPENINFS